ncbi:hypothetical protein ACHAW6_009524 [Cyclotella cf. meneghiniana]
MMTNYGLASSNPGHGTMPTDTSKAVCINTQRGRLFHDRDYHVHLGGAIPHWLIAQWIDSCQLSTEDDIFDLVAPSKSGHAPLIKVRDAINKYRRRDFDTLPVSKLLFLSAYNSPKYKSLPIFLTMYRAYSKRHLLHEYATTIAKGEYMHLHADVRVSLPVPNENAEDGRNKESTYEYALRAMKEMVHFQNSLLPTQRLFITIPRQTFNININKEYFDAFVELLSESITENDWSSTSLPMREKQQPAFDFAGQPLSLTQTIQLLSKLRITFPHAFICYHHGEVCPGIPFTDRVKDTLELLPYVNRIGHGLCLGLAVLRLYPDENGRLRDALTTDTLVLDKNRDIAYQCLHKMAELNIGIEVSPTCNVTLGGASSYTILRKYVKEFLDAGVDVFVGTDDPGFLNTTMEEEIKILRDIAFTNQPT